MTDRTKLLSLAGALACMAGAAGLPALAQQARVERRVGGGQATAEVHSRTHIVIVRDGHRYEVTSENGETTVLKDGKILDGAMIEENPDGTTRVLGPDGELITTISPPTVPPVPPVPPLAPVPPVMPAPPAPPSWAASAIRAMGTAADARPRIGVLMQEVPESLRHHLGLAEGEGVLVADVTAGYPAQEAGLQRHDVIVGVNGQDGATSQQLREAVEAAGEGKPVRLRVRRGDETLEISVEPRAPEAAPDQTRWFGRVTGGEAEAALAELEALLDEALARVKDERLAERAEAALDRLRVAIERGRSGPLGQRFMIDGDDGTVVIRSPFGGFSFSGPDEAEVERLQAMLEGRMLEMHARLEEQARRMAEQAERMAEQMQRQMQHMQPQARPTPPGAPSPETTDSELERRIERLLREREQQRQGDGANGADRERNRGVPA